MKKKQLITWKFSNFLMLVLITMISFSCDDDTDEFLQNNENLVGDWSAIYTVADEPLFDINNDGANSIDIMEELECQYFTLQLNNDFTYSQTHNIYSFNSDNDEYSCIEDNTYTSTGFWTVNEELTMITFSIDGNDTYVPIAFNNGILSFRSGVPFLNKNAEGIITDVYGKVFYEKNW